MPFFSRDTQRSDCQSLNILSLFAKKRMFIVKMGPFFPIGRIDMIRSAFERFTRILFNGAIYEALICIIEKNGAIFVILLRHFWMKICEKSGKCAISRKIAPFFILWLHVSHDLIFWRLWTQWTHPQLSGAYNTFHIRRWRHFLSNCAHF